MSRAARWIVIAPFLVVLLAYGGASLAFYMKQAQWIHASPRDRSAGPQAYGLAGVEERISVAGTAESLGAWWLPAAPDSPAVLYLVGVGHNLGSAAPAIGALAAQGLSVLAIEYRGFGASDGRAVEAGLYRDATIAWGRLVERTPAAPSRSLYGHSIGGAVAIELAARVPGVAAIVTESTFTSMEETIMQSRIMRALPTAWLLDQRYESIERVGALAMPKLFLHGTADDFVPPEMSRRLFEAARAPKARAEVCGAGHSDTLSGSRAAQALVGRFLMAPGPLKPPAACLPRESA